MLSSQVSTRRVYTHTGWRKIGGLWAFLHAGGAIGQAGPVPDVAVELPEALPGLRLPDPPAGGEDLRLAARASLEFLEVAGDLVTVPTYSSIWRVVLGSADFTPFLSGPTGAGKTELAALAQQHFGPGLDSRHLPGSWSSTSNAL